MATRKPKLWKLAKLGQLIAAAICLLLLILIPGRAEDWKPIEAEVLSLQQPRIEINADVEAVSWETTIKGNGSKVALSYYARLKIFTQRGAQEHGTIDLFALNKSKVRDVRGRTVKPDGRVLMLEDASIFQRSSLKAKGVTLTTQSFSMPNVEVGDMIEYQWTQQLNGPLAADLSLPLQLEFPSWAISYHVGKDLPHIYGLHNCEATRRSLQPVSLSESQTDTGLEAEIPCQIKSNIDQGYSISSAGAPAFIVEPMMFPELEVRPWAHLYVKPPILIDYLICPTWRADVGPYGNLPMRSAFWDPYGRLLFKAQMRGIKIDRAIKSAAESIAGQAAGASEKVRLILAHCLNNVKNIEHGRYRISPEERAKFKPAKQPSDTLRNQIGTGWEINQLFTALLMAAGLDARIAHLCGRENRLSFRPEFADPGFLDRRNVAVSINGEWRFFNLSAPYLTPGMLTWPEEGVFAMIPDPLRPIFTKTRMSGPDETVTTRSAHLRLSEDGTLEGMVRVDYQGHASFEQKELFDGEAPEKREQMLREMLKEQIGEAEFSEISFQNVTDLTKPYGYSYRVSAPRFATRAGERLFLQPSYFQRNSKPIFPSSQRKHGIYFHYAWSEKDSVVIELPEGYDLETPGSPVSYRVEGVGSYYAKLWMLDGRKLAYRRDLVYGENTAIVVAASEYPNLKAIFDAIHQQDEHTVALQQVNVAVH